jgi:hypothetical protein
MAESELNRLEQDAQKSRADLAETVDELRSRVSGTADDLRHRVSPEGLKENFRGYIGRTQQEFVENMKQKATENPLAAVAVGAGLAYMGWRIVRTIPAPLLLLGGGLALLKSGGRGNGAGSTTALGYGHLGDHDTAEGGKRVASGVETVRARVGEAAASAGETARRMASTAASAVSDVASSAYQTGVGAAVYAGDQAAEARRKSQDILIDTLERHPLLVGGVSIAVGALIGASLPMTETEQRLLGEKSDELKEQASKAASESFVAAEATGRRIVKEALGETTFRDEESKTRGASEHTTDGELEQAPEDRRVS